MMAMTGRCSSTSFCRLSRQVLDGQRGRPWQLDNMPRVCRKGMGEAQEGLVRRCMSSASPPARPAATARMGKTSEVARRESPVQPRVCLGVMFDVVVRRQNMCS